MRASSRRLRGRFVVSAFHRLKYLARRGQLLLSKGPRYTWVFVRWQAGQWARQVGLCRRPWLMGDSAFWSRFDLDIPTLAEAAAAVRSGAEEEGEAILLGYFRRRGRPRFFFDWADRPRLLARVGPEAQTATVSAANLVAQRTFCFRGEPPVTFDGPVDWTNRPHGNTDWMWDLSRHLYFITLGQALWYTEDTRYAQAFTDLLTDWLGRNPAGERQPNWSSPFEVACRINTWLWAYYLFMGANALDAATHLELLRGLWTHGAYLDACLELHVPNNHLLLEAKALAMLGLLLPEFRAARRWRLRGLGILEREVERQVCPDGVHTERVPHYHRLIAGELLELLVLLEDNDLPLPPALVDNFGRMIEFERHITRPDGRIPLFGDSAHGDAHVRFAALPGGAAFLGRPDLKLPHGALDEMTIWLLGPDRAGRFDDLPARPPTPSRCFPHGGFAVMRDGWEADGLYLAVDCGPFGDRLSPGHGHADALSLELHAHGRPQLVDSGVFSFQLGERWRNGFRGTRAHNTVMVDGQDQSILLDSWRVWRPAHVTLNDWASGRSFDFVDAAHDGYCRLPGGIMHRRLIFFVKSEYWVVVDLLTGMETCPTEGAGRHHFEALFHLPAGAHVQLDPRTGVAIAGGLAIAPLHRPDMAVDVTDGWVSYCSGEKKQAPVVVHTLDAEPPVVFQTLLYPLTQGTSDVPAVTDLSSDARESCGRTSLPVIALALEHADYRDVLIWDGRRGLKHKRVGAYDTDATLAYVRCPHGGSAPSRIILRHGTYLAQGSEPVVRKAGQVDTLEIV